ncbi:hypothetical protein BH09MYX1_BH09MYX1_41730 [soil metagenome]
MRARFFLIALVGCGSTAPLDLLPLDGAIDVTTSDAPNDAAPCTNDGCPCGLTACDGGCFDLANDPQHCGSCTRGCPHYAYCAASACACLPSFTSCGSSCFRFGSDPDHCGGCNAAPCTAGMKCEEATCGAGTCGSGLTGCVVEGRTACVDLAAGVPFCGACGVTCAPDEVCAAGKCTRYAPATPCAKCPCSADCQRTVGTTTCCPGIAGGSTPICVAGSTCP